MSGLDPRANGLNQNGFGNKKLGTVKEGKKDYTLDINSKKVTLPKIPATGNMNTDGKQVFLDGDNGSKYQLQYGYNSICSWFDDGWQWKQLKEGK